MLIFFVVVEVKLVIVVLVVVIFEVVILVQNVVLFVVIAAVANGKCKHWRAYEHGHHFGKIEHFSFWRDFKIEHSIQTLQAQLKMCASIRVARSQCKRALQKFVGLFGTPCICSQI